MDHIEFIVTLRCDICNEIVSLDLPLVFEKAQETIKKFTNEHKHITDPWTLNSAI